MSGALFSWFVRAFKQGAVAKRDTAAAALDVDE
jgi:hypothetical protein